MRTVIVRYLPTLDAALLRFDSWWELRSRRERTMLGVLAALVLGIVLVFGIIRPLQATRAQALADIRTYETLNARIRAAGTLAPASAAPRMRSGTPMQVVGASATSFGVQAAATEIPQGVRATVADASYDSLMAWLADLGTTSRLRIARVQVTRRPTPGRVAATVDFLS